MTQATQTPMARPTMVTVAAWILIVLGVLVTLAGLFLVIGSGALAGFFGPLAGLGIVLGIIVLALGVLEAWSGIAILGGKGWARITGLVLSALFGLLSLLSVITAFTTPAVTDPTTGASVGGPGSAIGPLVGLLLYGFVFWALIRESAFFRR